MFNNLPKKESVFLQIPLMIKFEEHMPVHKALANQKLWADRSDESQFFL
jgi:hypothetical protein